MSKTLILIFHPDLAASRANRALAQAAASVPGVEIVDVAARCPDGRIDTDVEVADLLSADRLVLQFPIRWYSTPPLMKAWQDLVLTRMMYLAPQTEGVRLAGVPVMVAATAGNYREAYGPQGMNLFPLAELLKPLEATANRCGLAWSEPHLVYEADKVGPEQLAQEGERYAERLRAWTRQTAERRLIANA